MAPAHRFAIHIYRDVRAAVAVALFACVAIALVVPAFALAYDETGTGLSCTACHGGDPATTGPAALHGGYMTATSRCQTCHAVHSAPYGSVKLLPGPTVKSTCEACHDGTGGQGVYGAIDAQGLAPVARHRVDITNFVPGGSEDGTGAVAAFSGEGGALSCNDCHSVHGSDLVEPFLGDRLRTTLADDTRVNVPSAKLLRARPTGGDASVTHYGSDWCGACHKGRLSTSEAHNHPTDSIESSTAPTWEPFHYGNVARLTGPATTEMGPLGRSNRGYLMPYPRTAQQEGHAPICQQCHEDARSVGTSETVEPFVVTAPDGGATGDNPRFQVFPHESLNPGFLVETGADLCTNCHAPGQGG